MSAQLSLNLGSQNTLLFALNGEGDFTAQVSITRVINTSSSAFSGVTLPMSEVFMPTGHSRVFIAYFTPTESGEYIFSYYGTNSGGEVARAIQRGVVSSSGGGFASGSSTFGVGL
jgi:hypothetical protein